MEPEYREAAAAVRGNSESIVSAERKDGLEIFFLALTVDVGVYQGDSTHVVELVSNLRRMGHRVRLVARRSGKREIAVDPPFHSVSRFRKPASDFMRLLQLLLSMARGAYYILRHMRGADIIYSRDRFSVLLALLPSKLLRKNIVYEVNGITSEQRKMSGDYLLNRLYVWLLETLDMMAFKNAVSVVCVTDAIRNFYIKRHPQYADIFLTINNGVSTELFHPLPEDGKVAELRSRLGFEENNDVVAYIGNLSLWQGTEFLVKSVPIILKNNPNARFMIVGHGPMHSECQELSVELGVDDKLKFVGQVPYSSLPYYINVADVCVAPYTRDIPNCPIKIYEYLACGKPVVCSDIPGVDNLRHTGALALVEPGNSEALASALLEAIADMEGRSAQVELGPKVISEYTWTNTARKVSEVCEAAAGRDNRQPCR